MLKPRTIRRYRLFITAGALLVIAEQALAQFPGPFEFSFATSFLNNVFLLPFRVGGCL